MKGKIKWFDNAKGYGFIQASEGETVDIFVHYSEIQGEGYKILREGDSVSFEVESSPKGPIARHILPIVEEGAVETE